jgi:hypothetical protein
MGSGIAALLVFWDSGDWMELRRDGICDDRFIPRNDCIFCCRTYRNRT